MAGRRKEMFPGWMPGLYRKVGKRVTTYYTIVRGKYQGLGGDLPKARRELTAINGDEPSGAGTIAELLDDELARRRRLVGEGRLSARTLKDNEIEAKNLKGPLGKMAPKSLRKKHVWDYLHKYRGVKAPVRANREVSLLSCAFAPLIATEVLPSNPCADVAKNEETPRERKVSREELYAFLAFARAMGDAGKRVANGLELSYLTTKAQGQILKLHRTRLRAEGVEWPARKKGAPTLTQWTPALRACVEGCLAMPAKLDSVYVVYNRDGQPYTSEGFKANVGRLMRAWAKAGNPRFTFHDAGRAAGITKLKEDHRNASDVSGHMQEKTIARVYDRRTFRKAPAVE